MISLHFLYHKMHERLRRYIHIEHLARVIRSDDRMTSSRFDHGDGDIVDGLRRRRGLGFRRERRRQRGDVPQAREQGRHGWLRELRVVADEHEQDVGHGRPDVGVLLHAEQADVVAPPRLVLGVGPPQRRVHELGRAIFAPQLPCLYN